jgi:ABC-type glycerol-3-phosphate transport system substrate-binding protein
MQQPHPAKLISPRRVRLLALITVAASAAAVLGIGGCGPSTTVVPTEKAKPYAGAALRVSCPHAEFAKAIAPLARAWAGRHDAKVEVVPDPMAPGDAADLGVIPVADLGSWADRGELVPAPTSLRAAGNAYQRQDVIDVYRERLAGWGRQTLALPLAGGGAVIVYRADRLADPPTRAKFSDRFGRPPDRLATWEDFAEWAELLAALDGKPSLPPAPDDPDRLADLFFRVAACYDRPALNDAALARRQDDRQFEAEILSFQYRADTGRPRLESPGFVAAAGWLARLRAGKCLPDGPPEGPAAALARGAAALAVVSLTDLAELSRLARQKGMVPLTQFAVAPLPGTRAYFDPASGKPTPAAAANYIPYFAGGLLGVVRTRCANPDAAFDLLADLGGPTRSRELVSATELGVGPFRESHLSPERLVIWLEYGFDHVRSKALQAALQQNVRADVRNPAIALRTPDHAALTAALAGELRRVARGEEADAARAMERANAAWQQLDAKAPADQIQTWRRRAAGLD